MKKWILVLAVGAIFLTLVSYATTVTAAPAFEDPQLCIEGKLFRADPTTDAIEVWVVVGPDVNISYDVLSCGGDPNLPVIDADHVSTHGKKKWAGVVVQTEPKAKVVLSYGDHTKVEKANHWGWAFKAFKVK